jgi:outer membrane protein TolC
MLIENPLLEELALKVKASETSEQAIIKQGLPKLGVGLDYVVIDKRTDMAMPDNGKDALMPMVTMNLPIFRSKYKPAIKEAHLLQESYSLQQKELSNQLSTSYDRVFFELEKQMALLLLYKEQIQQSQQSLNLLFSAYGNSGKDFENVLQMQQQILKYQKMSATALAEYHIAESELNYLTANCN